MRAHRGVLLPPENQREAGEGGTVGITGLPRAGHDGALKA